MIIIVRRGCFVLTGRESIKGQIRRNKVRWFLCSDGYILNSGLSFPPSAIYSSQLLLPWHNHITDVIAHLRTMPTFRKISSASLVWRVCLRNWPVSPPAHVRSLSLENTNGETFAIDPRRVFDFSVVLIKKKKIFYNKSKNITYPDPLPFRSIAARINPDFDLNRINHSRYLVATLTASRRID